MRGIHGGDIYRNKVSMDFSVNINPLGMPEGVTRGLLEAIEKCREYPDMEAFELKQAVSSLLHIPTDYLAFGNGASELFMAIVHAVRPEKILIPIPSFYGYEYVSKAVAAEITFFPLDEKKEFLPGEDLLDAITDDMDLVFLANPNNPTGKMIEKKYLLRFLTICKEKNIIVVLDECFIEFCGGEYSMISEIEAYDNLLLVRAFTKLYAIPGVRLGYLVCSNKALLDKMQRHIPEWNLSTFAQRAGVACVNQTEYVKRTVALVKKERDFLSNGLKKLGFSVFDSDANFVLVSTEFPLYERLIQRGILVRNCENFKGLIKGYYRIAVKQREENEKLLKVIGECFE